MNPLLCIVGVLLSIFATICEQAPAASSTQYEIGSSYSYHYETSIILNEPEIQRHSPTKDVGFKMDLEAIVTPVWQNPVRPSEQLLQLEVFKNKMMVKSRDNPESEFIEKETKPFVNSPFYLRRIAGKIENIYTTKSDLSLINIKKGIASLFQYETVEGSTEGIDTSGKCDIAYKQTNPHEMTKIKRNCRIMGAPEFYNHTNKIMGATFDSEVITTYEFHPNENYILKASTFERHFLRPEVRKSVGAEILSSQSIIFKDKIKSSRRLQGSNAEEVVKYIAQEMRKSFVAQPLNTDVELRECIACKSLQELVKNFRGSLTNKNLGTQNSAVAFLKLLRKFRESDSDTIKKTLKSSSNTKILPQLLDIAAAAQTLPSHNAAMGVLNFMGGIALPERYLSALSVTTHPLGDVIEDLLVLAGKKIINSDKLYETLVLSISAMTHTLSINEPRSLVPRKVRTFILEDFNSCRDETCKLIYLRSLKNLRDGSTINLLLEYAKGKEKKLATNAMRALETMPINYFDQKIYRSLERIFLQLDRLHDWGVRAMALGILLKHVPSDKLARDIFNILNSEKTREFNTLILGQSLDISQSNRRLGELLMPYLNSTRYANYHSFGQGGMSAMYSKPLVKDVEANASFSSVLEMSGGVLRRSTVDVIISALDHELRLLSFGVFAGGLSMFGDKDSEEEDDEPANAGMEITLMNSQLRPFVFFTGQGELMGHVWSGTGSERTTALQGNVLLQDHNEYLALQNGFNMNLLVTGVVSYDLAGQIELSLWNKNAHSIVEVGAALVVQGQARLDSSYVQTMIEFNVGTQAQLNFITDLDFSNEVMMCLQMVQPSSKVVDSVRKLERIPESNYALRKYKRRTTPIPGKTYAVNKKNTEMCSKMLRKR